MASVREHSASVMGWWNQCDRIMDAPSDAGVKHSTPFTSRFPAGAIRFPETFTYVAARSSLNPADTRPSPLPCTQATPPVDRSAPSSASLLSSGGSGCQVGVWQILLPLSAG
jgi:hypothetical protein